MYPARFMLSHARVHSLNYELTLHCIKIKINDMLLQQMLPTLKIKACLQSHKLNKISYDLCKQLNGLLSGIYLKWSENI